MNLATFNGKNEKSLSQIKWYAIIIIGTLAVMALLFIYTDIFPTARSMVILLAGLGVVVIFMAILTGVSSTRQILGELRENGLKLGKLLEATEKSRGQISQINQTMKLSDPARALVFRDADRQALREVVFDKLHQKDFETTYAIIEEMGNYAEYKGLAKGLKMQADGFRDASDQERVNQVITHIGKLLDNHEWLQASIQIDRLIASAPKSEQAKGLRQTLRDKKEERKKVLLQAWDDAVKRQDTDRSLEILRELDTYLTPNEGLALQEAARDVFRTKLHNMGVQFALSVSERQWKQAYQTGVQIITEFPNSKMAQEIREKIDILRRNSGQQ